MKIILLPKLSAKLFGTSGTVERSNGVSEWVSKQSIYCRTEQQDGFMRPVHEMSVRMFHLENYWSGVREIWYWCKVNFILIHTIP
jgi:hypothetical protein